MPMHGKTPFTMTPDILASLESHAAGKQVEGLKQFPFLLPMVKDMAAVGDKIAAKTLELYKESE